MSDRALVGNAEDPQQQRRARSRQQRQMERERNDLREVLARPEGRRLLHRVMRRGGLLETTFSTDAAVMACLAGQRDVALWLLAEINAADANAFPQMLVEAANLELIESPSEPDKSEPVDSTEDPNG